MSEETAHVGFRVDLTSEARREQLGLAEPVSGWVTESMLVWPGDAIDIARFAAPMAQPELAFQLDLPLHEATAHPATLLSSIETVHAAAVVTDAGVERSPATGAELEAANLHTVAVFVGPLCTAPTFDLAFEACVVDVGGTVVDSATGAALDGHPVKALRCAATAFAARGITVPAHTFILTGGLTRAVPLAKKPVRFEFTHLGSINVNSR